jgi:hypothetical protein
MCYIGGMNANAAAGANAGELEDYKQRCMQYEQHIEEIKNNYEQRLIEYKNKYLEIKERYDLLVYKRFARSAEQLLEDAKQQLLFAEEAEPDEEKEETEEFQTVRSFKRKNGGRKPLSANLERREKIIDIPESEKTCACGAKLTRIGEETAD